MSDLESTEMADGARRGIRPRLRRPVQGRSQERLARALAAAEALLVEIGPERLSIPEIEKTSGVPRASVYQYFPDKHALLSHLSKEHIQRLENHVANGVFFEQQESWKDFVRAIIGVVVDYYNDHAVASVLLLNGPFGGVDHEARLSKDSNLAHWFRAQVQGAGGLIGMPDDPDAAALAIEIGFACLKHGYGREGRISDDIRDHAVHAVNAYLAAWE